MSDCSYNSPTLAPSNQTLELANLSSRCSSSIYIFHWLYVAHAGHLITLAVNKRHFPKLPESRDWIRVPPLCKSPFHIGLCVVWFLWGRMKKNRLVFVFVASTTTHKECSCVQSWSQLPDQLLPVFWKIVYWMSQILTWWDWLFQHAVMIRLLWYMREIERRVLAFCATKEWFCH